VSAPGLYHDVTIRFVTWMVEPVPADMVQAVRAEAATLVDHVIDAIRAENDVYADVLSAPEGVGIRLGIEQAIRAFLDAVERGERPTTETGEAWRRLGEAEFQAGRSLEALRAAWRTGTRAAWRGAADLAAAAGVPTPIVISLAEAIFVYTDELATDVVEGYLRMQSDEAGERERRRRRLAALLLDADDHDPAAIEHAAELARWPLPRTLAVLALDGDAPGTITRRLDVDVLVGGDPSGAWLIVPDPDGPGRRGLLKRALGSQRAALGPVVEPRDASRSLRWARMALGLVRQGRLDASSPVRAESHLATLILLADEEMARALTDGVLAPLRELSDGERRTLLDTLGAWLAHQRHAPKVAAELHVHPQTVRYRIAKLRELLGDALESPDGRFELELALRVDRALSGGAEDRGRG
jgi:hypothetical protein